MAALQVAPGHETQGAELAEQEQPKHPATDAAPVMAGGSSVA